MIYKKKNTQKGIFDEAEKLESLAKYRDPLAKIKSVIDFELFRKELEMLTQYKIRDPKKGGRPAYDVVLMMKVLIIQHLYNLSDDETEFQIFDRMSFTRFLGLGLNDDVPDGKTIWLFKDRLGPDGVGRLFKLLNKVLSEKKLILNKGKIVDATIVEAPRQRNNREENQQLKEGKVPESWQENPHKLRQKDTDAKWVKKHGENYFGYKNHIKVDEKSKLVCTYEVTNASVHDSQVLDALLNSKDKNQRLHGDSAYRSDETEKKLRKKKITSRIHEKGYRGAPMTKAVKKRNTQRSKIRARVEHVFGAMHTAMGGIFARTRSLKTTSIKIGLTNLTYNLLRITTLKPEVCLVG
jgi:transposase, IS5 family